jgi:hypothetical protein
MPTLVSSNWFSVPSTMKPPYSGSSKKLPSDAVRVVISSASWHGYGPTKASGAE